MPLTFPADFAKSFSTMIQSVKKNAEMILLLSAAIFVFYAGLDGPLLEPDEARYAEIPRLMLRNSDWLVPKLDGKPYNDKPPLVYWLIAGSYSLFGTSITAARLIPATAGFLTLLIVYIWSRHHLGKQIAFASGFVLLTMIGFISLNRMLLLDGVLALCITASFCAGYHALRQSNMRYSLWWFSAICCGLGILTKGPVALVLVGPPLFLFRWIDRESCRWRLRDWVGYGLLSIAIAAPWYISVAFSNPQFFADFFWRHNVMRFVSAYHHGKPFWYYFIALPLETLPWSPLFLLMWSTRKQWNGALKLITVFCVWMFLFFSMANAKLPTYLLPMLPWMAVLAGNQIILLLERVQSTARWERLHVALLMILILAAGNYATVWHQFTGELEKSWSLVLGSGLMAALIAFGWIQLRERRIVWVGLSTLLVSTLVSLGTVRQFAAQSTIVPASLTLLRNAQEKDAEVVLYRNSWDALNFAVDKEVRSYSSKEWNEFVTFLSEHPLTLVLMRNYEGRIEEFVQQLPSQFRVTRFSDYRKIQGIWIERIENVTRSE